MDMSICTCYELRMSREVTATAFKARALALLEQVERTRVPLVVTRRGRPVARIVPIDEEPASSLLGSVSWASEDDLLAAEPDLWDADR
jgi:prevent-host-death family protein